MDEDSGRIEWEERFALANEIARELVRELGLRDWNEALQDPDRPDTQIYKSESDLEVRIIGEVTTDKLTKMLYERPQKMPKKRVGTP